ncbi:MAG: class I SAM-dependent methyltransferase [Desulfobacterales bacterium]|nr:MAG: class I SAM-dependent methyltransferase [Desulfobacterales bacterium]UCD91100.1 MAG: class I SAM-dependent methyltransferase [Desulfobacterales bacterium]
MKKPDPCILCGASEFMVTHQKNQWQYLCCQNCGLISIHPRPTFQVIMECYRNYLPDQAVEIDKWKKMMEPVNHQSADLIEARTKHKKGKLFDIGCGYGFFLQEMNIRGWQVSGLEISKTGRQFARNTMDLTVFSEPLEHLSLPNNAFDVVTLFYVIEHVLDPLLLLKEINRILKSNGLVLIRWPHTTPIVKILGPLSKKLDLYHTPFHLYDFSLNTMASFLAYAGFSSIETVITGHTRPSGRLNRYSSMLFGRISDALFSLSRGKILLPGISKTTLAIK